MSWSWSWKAATGQALIGLAMQHGIVLVARVVIVVIVVIVVTVVTVVPAVTVVIVAKGLASIAVAVAVAVAVAFAVARHGWTTGVNDGRRGINLAHLEMSHSAAYCTLYGHVQYKMPHLQLHFLNFCNKHTKSNGFSFA